MDVESILKSQKSAQEFMITLAREQLAGSGQALFTQMVDLTRAFQIQNGLKVDGKPGPITLARVKEVLAEAAGEMQTLPPPADLPNLTLSPDEWLYGVDIDHYQTIEGALDPNLKFAFVGVSEGTSGRASQDPKFRDHLSKLKMAGVEALGVYHFARPSSAQLHGQPFGRPEGEVDNFVRQWELAEKIAGKLLPPVLDMEDDREQISNEALVDWTLEWCERCEKLIGRRPIIYTYFSFIQSQLRGYDKLIRYPLWLADYGRQPPNNPRDIAGWPWLFWQFTGTGTVRGIPGPCDRNVFRGTQAQLEGLLL